MATDQTELAVRQLPMPATGELVDLSGKTGDLARALDEALDLIRRLNSFRKVVGEELLGRMDSEASWTTRAGQYELRGESPAPKVDYDGHDLALTLAALTDEGLISADAALAACEQVVLYKPKVRGINALKKLGGEVKERIEKTERTEERDRKVPSVKRLS